MPSSPRLTVVAAAFATALAALMLAAVSPAGAQQIFYGAGPSPTTVFAGVAMSPADAFAAFLAAVHSPTTETFDGFADGTLAPTFAYAGGGTVSGAVTFFGIIVPDDVITGVDVANTSDDAILIDDVTVGVASTTTPGPATLALLATGLGALGTVTRLRMRRQV